MSRLDQIRRMSDDDLILFLRRYKSEKSSCNRCTKKDTRCNPYFIIYTPERRIGKTEAALYLAHEYNMPYLVKLAQLDFVKRQAKEAGYNIKFVPLSRPQIEGMRLRTILKDECIKTKEAREYIGKYINIIGIEEI